MAAGFFSGLLLPPPPPKKPPPLLVPENVWTSFATAIRSCCRRRYKRPSAWYCVQLLLEITAWDWLDDEDELPKLDM